MHPDDATTSVGRRSPLVDQPQRIGPYRILQVLGEGGMGTVYVAEQSTPIARRVALKVLKLGMDTKEFVARFEAERQALAVMDHPGIAHVYDAGATETGRPFFAMELVHGVPLTEYCDSQRLGMRDRIELMISLCHAVQHAHQKGVIHRDLKPSNILVGLRDGRPYPKIIDFGVARALDRQLTNLTLYTEVGQRIGTPAYMSPEQMEMSGLDIDTRTDIYSLGVILYEVLAGTLPFSEDLLRRAVNKPELLRQTETPTPSSRVTGHGRELAEVASRRHSDPGSLRQTLAGDLDWITLKAMAMDRTERYDTATGLAMDLQRYLAFEPVTARPPSARDRVAKFVRRHRVGVAVAVSAVILVVTGAAVLALQAQRLARERDRATREAARAGSIATFLQDTLSSADPWSGGARNVSVADALASATAKIDKAFVSQPLDGAVVRRTIASTYAGLGLYDESERLARSALESQKVLLGPAHQEVAETLAVLANVFVNKGQYEAAEASAREALSIRQKLTGNENDAVADSLGQLAGILENRGQYKEAEARAREALDIHRRVRGPRDEKVAADLRTLAAVVGNGPADLTEVEKLLREALEIRRSINSDNVNTAVILNDLAINAFRREDYPHAESLYVEALATQRRLLGEAHPEVAATLENLGGVYFRTKRYNETLKLLDQVLAMRKKALGENHTAVGRTLHNIGVVRNAAQDYAGAVAALTEGESRLRATLGPSHPELVTVCSSLGDALRGAGQPEAAEKKFKEALALGVKTLPSDHPDIARARLGLGNLLVAAQRYADAEPLLLAAAEAREKRLGREHSSTKAAADDVARLYDAWAKPDKAAEWRARSAPR